MIGPKEAIENFIFKAFDFSGRATRSEFWFAFFFVGFLSLAALAVDVWSVMNNGIVSLDPTQFLFTWVLLLSFIPYLSLRVRRLHDMGRGGLFLLLDAIPLIGIVLTHIMLSMPSQPERNAWGEPPRHTFGNGRRAPQPELSFAAEARGQTAMAQPQQKPHNAFQSYAYLVNGEAEPTPDMIEQRRNEIREYYRSRVLGQA